MKWSSEDAPTAGQVGGDLGYYTGSFRVTKPEQSVAKLVQLVTKPDLTFTLCLLSLDRPGRRGNVRDDVAAICLHCGMRVADSSKSGMLRDVHPFTLSDQLFLCLPRRCPPSTVPCRMVLERFACQFPSHDCRQKRFLKVRYGVHLVLYLVLCSKYDKRSSLLSNAWIFFSVSASRVDVSQPYRRMVTTSVLNSLRLVGKLTVLLLHTLSRLAIVAIVMAIRVRTDPCGTAVHPWTGLLAPMNLKLSTSCSFWRSRTFLR